MTRPTGPTDSVAITGMACLFPGARDVDAYWSNILGKVDATSDPPPEAWDPDVYYDPQFQDLDRTYCKRGGYLGALARFDPLRHGVPPVAVGGEPDQWLALRVARDALLDAGAEELPAAIRARTSIVLGKGTYLNGGNAIAVQRGLVVGQTIELLRKLHPEHSEQELEALRAELQAVLPPLGPETVPGLIPNIVVGRIANRLDLMGPAYTVDAACASSLVAVRHAVRDLLAGDCDLALAGGSQVWMPVATMNLFCRLGALSRRERLRAFDKDADGTLLGEGIGIVVLKRLAEAVRDGDRVYAVIRGVGVSSDGRGLSVMAPRVEGEELALRRAYEDAGVSPSTVGLVEAHGTGTPVGDLTEVQALRRVFGDRAGILPPTALGTVKSMISHTIPAAGVAGLIKVALALHHRVLPPTIGIEQPNPKLELDRTPFYLNTEARPWIHGGSEPRRAGINAFGFGGINGHAVLEEFTGEVPAGPSDHRTPWESEVCVLAAGTPAELADRAERLAVLVAGDTAFTLADLAYTLACRLGPEPCRLGIVAGSLGDLSEKLAQAAEKLRGESCRRIKTMSGIYYDAAPLGAEGKVVFVFPGEGAQYPNMLADLCLRFPEARAVFDRIDRLYAEHPRGHTLSDWVFPRPAFSEEEPARSEARLMELDIAVESVLSANAAVYAVLRRIVRRIDAMLGHSTGEHSAAIAAGVLDVETDERLGLFCYGLHASYADAASRHEVPGAVLLALGTDADAAQRIAGQAGGELHLAMDNCPHQVVLVGEEAAIARAKQIATAEGLMSEQLPYDRAVHTPLFAPFAEDLRAIFDRLPVRPAAGEVWSCTTAAPYPPDAEEIRELLVEHWTSPVRFRGTIEALHDAGGRVFVEVGPRGNMTSFVQDILRGKPFCAVTADQRRRPGVTQLCHLVAQLAVHHVPLDLEPLFERRDVRDVDLAAPVAPAPEPATVALSTAWPMLRLAEEVVERFRRAPASEAPPPQPAPPEPPARQPPSPEAPARQPPSPEAPPLVPVAATNGKGNGHGPAPAPSLPPVAVGAPVADNDELTMAMAAHMQTMEDFLQTSEHVMHAFLSGAAPVVIEQARRPLVGTIMSWEPDALLIARRTVDLDSDPYLRDHTLGRSVSRHDPDLTALPLMPLAMSIEILAEAAACLLSDLTVIGLRELRASRWLDFADGPRTLELRAERLTETADGGAERVRVALADLQRGPEPVVEATVLLAAGYPAAPAAALPPMAGRPTARLDRDRLYGEAMFHGPLWQAVSAVDAVAPDAVQGRLGVLPRAGLMPAGPAPSFVLDPVILDAAGQLIGFWAADRFDEARVVFPFRLGALDLYRPPLSEGETLTCRAAIRMPAERLLSSDIEVLAPDGAVAMRLTGWDDKRFDVPDRLRALTLSDALGALTADWPELAALHSGVPVAARRVQARLPSDAGLWKQVWALRVLSRRERRQFAGLRTPAPRQMEWLGARTAAKEAVAELLRAHSGIDLLPADIELDPDDRGRPLVALPGHVDIGAMRPIVSLTHSRGQAAALAALVPAGRPAGVGLDVEHLATRPAGFAHAALSANEHALLPDVGDEWVLRLWCAKEAAGKSVGSGLAPGVDPPVVVGVDAASEHVLVDVGGRRLTVTTRRAQDEIVATTLWENR